MMDKKDIFVIVFAAVVVIGIAAFYGTGSDEAIAGQAVGLDSTTVESTGVVAGVDSNKTMVDSTLDVDSDSEGPLFSVQDQCWSQAALRAMQQTGIDTSGSMASVESACCSRVGFASSGACTVEQEDGVDYCECTTAEYQEEVDSCMQDAIDTHSSAYRSCLGENS